MKRVVVVGGGIAGLATAHRAARARGARAGRARGPGRRGRAAPGRQPAHRARRRLPVEWGPNGFLDNVPATLDLVRRIGLEGELMPVRRRARRAASSTATASLHLLPSAGRWSFLDLSRCCRCPAACASSASRSRPKHPGGDETVYAFAARRIGDEAALDPGRRDGLGRLRRRRAPLSLASCFPEDGGDGGRARRAGARRCWPSSAHAAPREARAREAGARVARTLRRMARPGGPAGPGGTLTSFRGGIETFIEALARRSGRRRARAARPVRALDGPMAGARWRLELEAASGATPTRWSSPSPRRGRAAARAARRGAADAVLAIPAAGLAVVALAYDGPPARRSAAGAERLRLPGAARRGAAYPRLPLGLERSSRAARRRVRSWCAR